MRGPLEGTGTEGWCGTQGEKEVRSNDLLDDHFSEEPPCIICGGEGTVDGQDYFDWQEDEFYDPFAKCPSCHGSGLAKDMTFC